VSYIDTFFGELSSAIESVRCTGPRGQVLTRQEAYERTVEIATDAANRGARQMFIGNGGSAAIASHMAIDFSKNGGMSAICFNDGAALTCLGNDYGYEEVFSRQIGFHAHPGDVLFAISSSGSSANILRAVEAALERGCRIVTFSGFSPDNPLRALGEINFHVGLCDYGIVEVAHTALIHAVVELKRANSRREMAEALRQA
jgi:D-sedoheptulose 7-phosphate isomerase